MSAPVWRPGEDIPDHLVPPEFRRELAASPVLHAWRVDGGEVEFVSFSNRAERDGWITSENRALTGATNGQLLSPISKGPLGAPAGAHGPSLIGRSGPRLAQSSHEPTGSTAQGDDSHEDGGGVLPRLRRRDGVLRGWWCEAEAPQLAEAVERWANYRATQVPDGVLSGTGIAFVKLRRARARVVGAQPFKVFATAEDRVAWLSWRPPRTPPLGPTEKQVLAALTDGETADTAAVAARSGLAARAVLRTIPRLERRGLVRKQVQVTEGFPARRIVAVQRVDVLPEHAAGAAG